MARCEKNAQADNPRSRHWQQCVSRNEENTKDDRIRQAVLSLRRTVVSRMTIESRRRGLFACLVVAVNLFSSRLSFFGSCVLSTFLEHPANPDANANANTIKSVANNMTVLNTKPYSKKSFC